jgi:hypothetical protein
LRTVEVSYASLRESATSQSGNLLMGHGSLSLQAAAQRERS